MDKNGKIIKWLGLTPMVRPNIKVELNDKAFQTQPIDYTHIKPMGCIKVGNHKVAFNNLIK